MKRHRIQRIEVKMDELEGILEHARTAPLSEEGHNKLKAALETLDFVTRQLEKKQISIARLRNLLFGPASEKTEKVFPDASEPDEPEVHSDGEEAASEEGLSNATRTPSDPLDL